MKKEQKHKINNNITNTKIRLTGDGYNGSILSLSEALAEANKAELDLVLLSESGEIGVCRIMNYEKFAYDEGKKPKQKTLDIKEVKIGFNISENDMGYRIKRVIEFLQKGHRVKISLQFRGREIVFMDKGKENVLKLIVAVDEYGIAESIPNVEGKKMFVVIRPKKKT